MLAIERQNYILEYLCDNKAATVAFLAEKFDVTKETIRRDLNRMEREGLLVRTSGGAYIPEKREISPTFDARGKKNLKSKEFIGRECAKLIRDGETIFLDSSTTAFHIALEITEKKLNVITYSLPVANALLQHSNIHLTLLGGDYDALTCSFCSSLTLNSFEDFYVDKAFFSCRSIDMVRGLTDIHENVCAIRKAAISHSHSSICVADPSKFDRVSFMRICNIADIDAIITDFEFNDAWKNFLDKKDVFYLGK